LPFLIYTGHWFGVFGIAVGACLYVFPALLWAVMSATLASIETRHTYPGRITSATVLRRFGRLVPYLVINTGMLAHQLSAFTEGLFGPLRSEFERTPKAGSVTTGSIDAAPRGGSRPAAGLSQAYGPAGTARKSDCVKVHWPYVVAEAFLVVYQLAWAVLFVASGLVLCAIGAAYIASCIVYLGFFYGDHEGRVCFVFERRRWRLRWARQTGSAAGCFRSLREKKRVRTSRALSDQR
jgi:hypothetical protein